MEKAHTIHCIVLLFLAVFFFLLYGMKAFFFTSFLFYELPLAILKGQPWGSNRFEGVEGMSLGMSPVLSLWVRQ